MHPLILVAIGVAGLLALTRKAAARPATPPGGGGSSGPAPVASATIRERFLPILTAYAGPMPPGAMLEIVRHESGGKVGVVVADQVTGASELGACQLVVEHDAAGNPKPGSSAGAIGADVDPLTAAGAIYGAQWVYTKAKERFAADLAELAIPVPPDTEVGTWIILMQAQHSMGRAGFRKLLADGRAAGMGTVDTILRYWGEEEMPPKLGRQSSALVRRRVNKLRALPGVAAGNAPLPSVLLPLAPRVAAVPRFDAAKAKRYILAERARGGRARKADGSPPGV